MSFHILYDYITTQLSSWLRDLQGLYTFTCLSYMEHLVYNCVSLFVYCIPTTITHIISCTHFTNYILPDTRLLYIRLHHRLHCIQRIVYTTHTPPPTLHTTTYTTHTTSYNTHTTTYITYTEAYTIYTTAYTTHTHPPTLHTIQPTLRTSLPTLHIHLHIQYIHPRLHYTHTPVSPTCIISLSHH